MDNLGPVNGGADVPRYDGAFAVVNHGSTAGTTRPTGAGIVFWIGSVTPTNASNGDLWVDTT